MSDWIFTFDLETTGTNTNTDRIVQIAGEKLNLQTGETESRVRLLYPEMEIPAEATAVHGITNEMVRKEPLFRHVAKSLVEWIGDAHLAGYNIRRFDLPILIRQLKECDLELDFTERYVVDLMVLYYRAQPRDLGSAIRHYLGAEAADDFATKAHDALEDVFATRDLLTVFMHGGEPLFEGMGIHELNEICDEDRPLELTPWDEWFKGSDPPRFQFGKHQGTLLSEAPSGYIDWMLGKVNDHEFTLAVEDALRRSKPDALDPPNPPDDDGGSGPVSQPSLFG